MEIQQLKAILEALIFVAEEPMTPNALGMVLGQDGVETAAIRQVLDELVAEYRARPERGIEIREVAGGYQLRTKPEWAAWIQRLNVPRPTRLSQAAMETLAIVAYRQPIVRAEVEEIRGVDCGGVLKTLLERNLIRIVGKREDPGSPLLYGTTHEFLSIFNLQRLQDLPSLKDYHALEEESHGTQAGSDASLSAPATASSTETDALAALAPIDPDRQLHLDEIDQAISDELEEQVRALRHLESTIFPRPVEQVDLLEREEVPGLPTDCAAESKAEHDNNPAE
ncbi:MAG: SMC-Scp complex subunit ScpB [Deltaproteobacteria bacterium]|nr:SMC-Scp complex subunit ScpB [Deltaproteobacteria bacterium]